jgi:hypothetical protein
VPLSQLLNLKESLSLPIKSSSTLVKKKPHYKMVSTKEAKPKKKIDSNIREQNVVTKKRIKKRLQAYIGFLANIINN